MLSEYILNLITWNVYMLCAALAEIENDSKNYLLFILSVKVRIRARIAWTVKRM